MDTTNEWPLAVFAFRYIGKRIEKTKYVAIGMHKRGRMQETIMW